MKNCLIRKWFILIVLSLVLIMLMLLILPEIVAFMFPNHLGPGRSRYRGTNIDFIELSTNSPLDKRTGIKLISVGNGEATVGRKGLEWDLRVDDRGPRARGLGTVRLFYASKEKGEVVLQKLSAANPQVDLCRRIRRKWQRFLSVSEDRIVLGYLSLLSARWNAFGFDLVSIESNGASIKLDKSNEILFAKDGEFYEIEDRIDGVDKLQLLRSSVDETTALFRLTVDKKQ